MSSYDYALPEYLRRDLAYQDIETLATPAVGLPLTYTVPGDAWCLPLAIRFNIATSATVADRLAFVRMADQPGHVAYEISAFITQPALLSRFYTFLTNISAAYGSSIVSNHAPLPAIWLAPSYTLRLYAYSVDAGDQLSGGVMICSKIPTGPPESYDRPGHGSLRLVPTPFV